LVPGAAAGDSGAALNGTTGAAAVRWPVQDAHQRHGGIAAKAAAQQ
jgi:hypothetical protein